MNPNTPCGHGDAPHQWAISPYPHTHCLVCGVLQIDEVWEEEDLSAPDPAEERISEIFSESS